VDPRKIEYIELYILREYFISIVHNISLKYLYRCLNEFNFNSCNIFFLLNQYIIKVSGMIHTRGESPWSGLGDMQTSGTTLASAYVLCHLSSMWSQFQIIERSLRWKWVLIWCVVVKHQGSSSIRVYLCWLSD